MDTITGYIGDSSSWAIALTHPVTGAAFEPGGSYGLVATFKNRENDSDANAVIQKATGAGITVSGSTATITLVRADTADFCECNLHFGIRATNASTGASFTVAERRVKFEKPTTLETTTSVDVITTEDPLPFPGIDSYVSEIESLPDYPASFPPASHTHVSADITNASEGGNGADDAGKLVKFAGGGSLFASQVSAYIEDLGGPALIADSLNGTSLVVYATNADLFTQFAGTGNNNAFVARVDGAFGWVRGAYTSRIKAASTLTGNHTATLPDASGTVALTSDFNNANVVAAIEEDPAAIGTALALVEESAATEVLLTSADSGKIIELSSDSQVDIVLPEDVTGNFRADFIQSGSGKLKFDANGSTLKSLNGNRITSGEGSWARLLKLASGGYHLRGDLAIHEIAAAYASTVALSDDLAIRLSQHLSDLEDAGIVPVQLTLGRSEWKARNGSSWRAVIGNAATITGTVTDATEGQQFPGTSGNYARFNNPIQNAALTELGMVVVGRALSGVTTVQQMLSGYVGASAHGPGVMLNSSPRQGNGTNYVYTDISSTTVATSEVAGFNTLKSVNTGGILALGMGWNGPNNAGPYIYGGAWNNRGAATTIATLWNNGSTWGIGSRPDNTTSINGAISYALVSSNTMTPDRYAAMYSSALKHGIFQTEATSVLVGMGDSLMEGGASGSSPTTQNTLTHKLTYTATGGSWQNACTAQNSGVGGSTIDSVEGIQKTNATRWARADGFTNRWVVHFGTHNDAGYQSSDEATRNALMERYIEVLNDLKALGAKIAVISPLDGSTATAPQQAATSAYRTRLATRCAEEGFSYVNLHAETGFSVASRNAAYFADTIHLTAAGYTRATELFVAAISSPDFQP